MNLYFSQNYKGDILLKESEISTEIIEKESKNFKTLSNTKKENYKENEQIKEKIKSNENLI